MDVVAAGLDDRSWERIGFPASHFRPVLSRRLEIDRNLDTDWQPIAGQ
jgi:hypothetical protein